MIIVADSGSTKTTWINIDSGNKVVTEGLNPHFTTDEAFLSACGQVAEMGVPKSVYFYGAGCGDEQQRKRVATLLSKGLATIDIHVETDMLGACRAVSGDKASIVGILGTGSNACYYNGKEIELSSPSLGYILGDEGSANHLGRELLDNYLKGKMSEELSALFHDRYPYTYTEWMDHIYHKPSPNRFLASLARFAVDNIAIDECRNDIWYVVDRWHSEQLGYVITRSHCDRINIIGSFGKAIEQLLRKTLSDYCLHVGTILADPIDALCEYHKKHP